MTLAKSTRFTQVQIGDGDDPEDFNTIAEVKSFDGPSSSAGTIDVSSFDSRMVEKIQALADGGELSLDLNFVGSDAGQQELYQLHVNGRKRNYRVVFNDHDDTPTILALEASVSSFKPSGATNAAYQLSVGLTVSGWEFLQFAPEES
jgi:hypothetical protein